MCWNTDRVQLCSALPGLLASISEEGLGKMKTVALFLVSFFSSALSPVTNVKKHGSLQVLIDVDSPVVPGR